MSLDVPLTDDHRGIYMRSAGGQSTGSSLVKLPAVLVRVDKEGSYSVEQVLDVSNSGDSVPLSDERWEDLEFPIVCPHCAEITRFVLGTCLVVGEQGGVLMQQQGSQDVYGPPIALLRVAEKRNCSIAAFLNSESDLRRTAEISGLDSGEARSRVTDGDQAAGESATETIAQCGAAIRDDPKNVDAHFRRAVAHLELQNYTSALKDLDRAIQLDTQHAQSYAVRGALNWTKGEDELAIQDLNRAIELDPNDLQSHVNRGICYYNTERFDLALKDMSRVLEKSSDPALTEQAREYAVLCKRGNDRRRCEKAISYINGGQRGNAIAELEAIMECNPENAIAYCCLASVYKNDEDYESALSALEKAIELDPELPGAYSNRGEVHLMRAHYSEAIADFSKDIEDGCLWVPVYRGRAIAYHEIAQYELAVADLKKALDLSDDRKLRAEIKREIRTVLSNQRSHHRSGGTSED